MDSQCFRMFVLLAIVANSSCANSRCHMVSETEEVASDVMASRPSSNSRTEEFLNERPSDDANPYPSVESKFTTQRFDEDFVSQVAYLPDTQTDVTFDLSRQMGSDLLVRLPEVVFSSTNPLADDLLSKPVTYRDLLLDKTKGIASDHREFYSAYGMTMLAGGLGAAALMANTGFDEHFMRDTYSENIVLAPSDELYEKLHQPKFLGDGTYTIPAFAIAALAEPLIQDLPLGSATAEWGQRSLRTILVGAPPMLALQLLTGASRPGESASGSHWQPFQDNNGVSGHSFMGAIPFISAAKMTDNIGLKSGLYLASALPSISRVNDDDHYFSQAFLGWWLAYVAASAVDRSYNPESHHHFFFFPQKNGAGVGVEYTY